MNKFKKILTVGIMCLTLTSCVTPEVQAREINKLNIQSKPVSFAYSIELQNNTKKMNSVIMQLMHRVNKTPYVFAGSSKYGWDCSGMVRWMYEQLGHTLPHSATAQARVGHRVAKPKVGDIVIFGYKGYKSFYHSAIYIGKGKVVNANSGAGTTIIEPLTNYKNSRIAYVRIIPTI